MNTIPPRYLLAALLAVVFALGTPAQGAAEPASKDDEAAEPLPETIFLGRFMLRDFRVTEGTKLRLSFALHAEFDQKHADLASKITKSHEHRIRNEIITAVRMADQSDFREPELARFRRRIYLRLRRAVPYLMVKRLLIGEFELMID